jgi:histidinol-phosphatase (PHP family)
MLTNYHSHSTFCDGKASLETMVQSAIEKKLVAFGCSGHAPADVRSSWHMKRENLPKYITEVQQLKIKYQNQIEIYTGLEIDFIPGIVKPSDFQEQLDYCLGAVHYVDTNPDGSPFCFDGSFKDFTRGCEEIFDGSMEKMITRYYELIREMVNTSPPDVIAHFDLVKKWNKERQYLNENDGWYQDAVKKTLDCIANSECIIEINTQQWYKELTKEGCPSNWIVKECFKRNIPMQVNSDTHHPDNMVLKFDEAHEVMKNAGYKTKRVLLNGEWQDIPLVKANL